LNEDDEPIAAIGGLYETVLETDPTRRAMTSRNGLEL